MGALVMMIVLGSLSVGICVLAVRLGRRPDTSWQEVRPLYRLFGLPQPGPLSDWPAVQLRANRDEGRNIANYRGPRQRA
jgi:hypothetical protein